MNFYNYKNLFQNLKQPIGQYNDDQEFIQNTHFDYDLDKEVILTVNQEFENMPIDQNEVQMGVAFSIDIPDKLNHRTAVDLLCILDVSVSMNGQSLQNVKETMKTLLNFLGEMDRLSIITFSDIAERIVPFIPLTEYNKNSIIDIIDQIRVINETNYSNAFTLAYEVLNQRRFRNQFTSIFFLSDGLDQSHYISSLQRTISKQEYLTPVYCFGYGMNDNSEGIMNQISNCSSGFYTYIRNTELLTKLFVGFFAEISSVVGMEMIIAVKTIEDSAKVEIKDICGAKFNQITPNHYKLQQGVLNYGTKRQFLVNFKFKRQITEDSDRIKIMQIYFQIRRLNAPKHYKRNYKICIGVGETIICPQVKVQQIKNQTLVKIAEAEKACCFFNYDQGQKYLDNMKENILQYQQTINDELKQELEQSLQYLNEANILLYQHQQQHIQQLQQKYEYKIQNKIKGAFEDIYTDSMKYGGIYLYEKDGEQCMSMKFANGRQKQLLNLFGQE